MTPLFAQAQAGGGLGQILFMLVAFGAIVYFLIIRPQQQQRKKHEEMVAALSRGDKIILQGGLYGKISKVNDDTLEVEIAPDVIVTQAKSMVMMVQSKPEPKAAKAEADKKPAAKKTTTAKKTSTATKKAPASRAKKPAAKSSDS